MPIVRYLQPPGSMCRCVVALIPKGLSPYSRMRRTSSAVNFLTPTFGLTIPIPI